MDLLSRQFVALALAAVLLLPVTRGTLRWLILFALNVAFVSSYLRPWEHPIGSIGWVVFMLAGFLAANWARRGGRGAAGISITLLTAAFIYMRRYGALSYVLPEEWFSRIVVLAGISYLFFKMVHVIVDSASGTIGDLRLATYVNYCLNFTAFLMGPIQRYQEFSDQWHGRTPSIEPGFEAHLDAVNRVLRGFVKKFVLAEYLGRWALNGAVAIETSTPPELLMQSYAFYLFLYCDFSGYCDIMIGVGSLMGVRPPENFYLPFLSRNVTDYWLRVHRSLTLWLTDYVFTPSFAAALRTSWLRGHAFVALALSLMLTMFVSGLWHGTTLSFLCFGLLHGVYLVVTRGYEQLMTTWLGRKKFRAWSHNRVVHVVAVLLTFNATSLAYVFFVLDAQKAFRFFARILGLHG